MHKSRKLYFLRRVFISPWYYVSAAFWRKKIGQFYQFWDNLGLHHWPKAPSSRFKGRNECVLCIYKYKWSRRCTNKAGRVVIAQSLGVAKGLHGGVGLNDLVLQCALGSNKHTHVIIHVRNLTIINGACNRLKGSC